MISNMIEQKFNTMKNFLGLFNNNSCLFLQRIIRIHKKTEQNYDRQNS